MKHPGFGSFGTAAGMLFVFGVQALAQGMASGNVPAAPKPKASGLPFYARFTDVAREAGLTMKFVNGRPDRKKYIVEANGTGVAFTDYNNDGRVDVFLVNSTRFEAMPKGQEPV